MWIKQEPNALELYKNAFWRGKNGQYIGCPRRNVPDFGRVFLVLKYTDITQNTYVQSWTVKEIMTREKCGLLADPRTVPVGWQSYPCPSLSVESYNSSSAHARLISECAVSFVTSRCGWCRTAPYAPYTRHTPWLSRPPPIQKLGAENHMLQLNI